MFTHVGLLIHDGENAKRSETKNEKKESIHVSLATGTYYMKLQIIPFV